MQVIAFEGIDASGKQTQVDLLLNALHKKGKRVAHEAFPRYNETLGGVIRKHLNGDIELTEKGFHALLEADRIDFMETMERLEKEGYDYLILDRYTLSNLAFGVAKGLSLDWLRSLQTSLRQPDITFVMDITADTSRKRRPEGRDKHELDDGLLNRARSAYVVLADKLFREEDQLIYLINANIAPPDLIHEEVLNYVEGILEHNGQEVTF